MPHGVIGEERYDGVMSISVDINVVGHVKSSASSLGKQALKIVHFSSDHGMT